MKTKLLIKTSKALTFFIVFAAIAALAAAGRQLLYESSGTTSFKLFQEQDGSRTIEETLQSYMPYFKYSEVGGEEMLLVSVNKTIKEYIDAEGLEGTTSWTVRKGPKLETLLWSKTEDATILNVNGGKPVLVSGLGGCCAELSGYRLFDLETGKLLMSFNDFSYHEKVDQPFSLEVPNSSLGFRYIGAISQDSTRDRDFQAPEAGKEATLLIKYASDSLKQELQVDMETAQGYAASVLEFALEKDPSAPDSDKIEINDNQVTLWNIDKATDPHQISGVLLKIVLNGGNGDKVVKIPVKNDQLDLSSAEIPAGVSIRALPTLRAF